VVEQEFGTDAARALVEGNPAAVLEDKPLLTE
jgi:hypothetical protein